MLFYVESKIFPGKTFVLVCDAEDTVARAKAHLLHILYELGRADLQFRLRYRGEYLKDAVSLSDYKVVDNCVVQLVTLAKDTRTAIDEFHDVGASTSSLARDTLLAALEAEVKIFKKREKLLADLKAFLWILGVAAACSLFTLYWYSFFWQIIIFLYGIFYIPSFSRLGGFVGKTGLYQRRYAAFLSILMLVNFIISCVLLFLIVDLEILACYKVPGETKSTSDSLHGGEEIGVFFGCKHRLWYTAVFFAFNLIVGVPAAVYALLTWHNFQFEIGTYIEPCLVQSKDITRVLADAVSNRAKSQRNAAFELNNLATTGEENKFKIVAEGGVQALITLSLSKDPATQEYAIEALAELLTIPSIQNQFIADGGHKTLTALLHVPNVEVVHEAAVALSYIAADAEENRAALTADHGLDDLCHAVKLEDSDLMTVIAGIFLDLAMSPASRQDMTENDNLAKALSFLTDTRHHETQRLALQTIELLALEDLRYIISEKSLLDSLLAVPETTTDIKLWTLAGKVLMYFADNPEGCSALIHADSLLNSLMQFMSSGDLIVQTAVAKIVASMTLYDEHRPFLHDLGFQDLLIAFRSQAVDQDILIDIDQALAQLTGTKHWPGMSSRHSSSRSLGSSGGGGGQGTSSSVQQPHRVKFITPD
ncbi:uncharacterized protein [Oscarella lobularis]|uniref:uncharacterized protein n=1 Tax=Oscarella lobularis TaxID=121494 RepID=UPI00331371DB